MNSELEELDAKYYKMFPDLKKIVYKGTILFDSYLKIADLIENFEVRDDDVWIVGHSKSGTSWTREMVWNIANGFNTEAILTERCPVLEFSGLFNSEVDLSEKNDSIKIKAPMENSVEFVKNLTSPRFIASHLPFHLLPRQLRTNQTKAKIVYVARNPKDLCISYYHFNKLIGVYTGDFEGFCKLFLNDRVIQSPFWKHVSSFWDRRNDGNILFLKYEDMKSNLRAQIKRTAEFLGKNFDDEQTSKLEEILSFENMKANPAMNREDVIKACKYHGEGHFMRKGEAGQWKTVMSKEMIEQFDNWTRENLKDNESLLREFL